MGKMAASRELGLRRKSRRSGVTLIELMVAALIGAIIFISWLSICNPKPVVRESYRRLAVEQAAGFMDLVLGGSVDKINRYKVEENDGVYVLKKLSSSEAEKVWPVFPDEPDVPVGYTLRVEEHDFGAESGWSEGPNKSTRAVVCLYDAVDVSEEEAGHPFFILTAFLK